DSSGQSLVHTIGAGRDAFFNITEGQSAALGSEATLNGQTVALDLSGVFAGTTATLILRLVNNDSDHNTSVSITCVQCMTGSGPVIPLVASGGSSAVAPRVTIASTAATLGSVATAGSSAAYPPAIAQATVGAASSSSVTATTQPSPAVRYGDLPMSFEA